MLPKFLKFHIFGCFDSPFPLYGRQLHGFIVRNELGLGLGSDVHLGCCLIEMYSKVNKFEKLYNCLIKWREECLGPSHSLQPLQEFGFAITN